MKKMRVLVVIYEFPPVGGGGGRVAEDICRGLVQLGHEVLVMTTHLKGLPREEEKHGINILRISSGRKSPFKAGFGSMLGYVIVGFIKGLQLIQSWKPDVIHVHFAVPSGAAGYPMAKLTRTPYIMTAHLGDIPGGVPEKTDRWFRWIYPFTPPIWRGAQQVYTVSGYSRDLALQCYDVDIKVIENGVDLNLLDPGTIQVGKPPRLVFAGRFVTQKNPVQIIRSLSQLRDLPWYLVMIGDGPLREEIEVEITKNQLSDRVTLTGWVTPDEVIDWFSKCDILFMPSLSEGLPVVGVQAAAMGIAIVAGRAGGFVDLVEDGENGYLLDGNRKDAGVTQVRDLISSPEKLFEFRKASRHIARRFDIQKIVYAYETALQQAMNR
jgi:glycosyltransferase involved in cell wall biosynthesis